MSMEDAPTNAPMAPRDSTRTSPSTDQLKVRRRLSMVDDSPGQRFVANLWTEMQNDVKETTDVDTSSSVRPPSWRRRRPRRWSVADSSSPR
jgi:hypothetical protein